MRRLNLVGRTFGNLKVIEIGEIKPYEASRWICKCKCGIIKSFSSNSLLYQKIASCGCLKQKTQKESRSWRGYGEISKSYFSRIKKGAKIRNLEMSVTIQQLWDIFLKQDKKCALSGICIHFGNIQRGDCTASIDRIDSSKGYVVENIQWVHKDINFMKQDFNENYFLKMCEAVVKYRKDLL